MTAGALRELLYDRPFTPFLVHVGNGRSVEVRHPEMAIVTDQEMAVAVEEGGQSRLRLLALLNINEVEWIEHSAANGTISTE